MPKQKLMQVGYRSVSGQPQQGFSHKRERAAIGRDALTGEELDPLNSRASQISRPPPHRCRHRPGTDMDLRKSFSKPLKKLKHRLTEGNRNRDGRSRKENDREKREADVGGGEASQRDSRLHLDVEDVVEGGPSRAGNPDDVEGKEVGRVDLPVSTPSISHGGESGSMQTTSLKFLPLISSLDNADNSAVSGRIDEVLRPNESELNAANENGFGRWKSTAHSTAKLLLRGVKESADTFGPLKSVVGGLYFILENCEVLWPSSRMRYP